MKRLISHDTGTGIKTYHDYDHSSEKTYLTTEQDVESILKRNKELQNNTAYRQAGYKQDMMHYATVPLTVLYEWKTKYNVDYTKTEDLPKIEKLLQSNEYKFLRVVDRI